MEPSKRFEKLVSETILFETGGDKSGAYSDTPGDSGGPTKWGISETANPDIKIKTLTYKQAILIYKTRYWNPLYDFITDDKLAFKVFDMGVLSGVNTSVLYLQKALKNKGGITLATDGEFGPMTLTAISKLFIDKNLDPVYDYYKGLLINRARRVVILKPWNAKFYNGWKTRINHNYGEPI